MPPNQVEWKRLLNFPTAGAGPVPTSHIYVSPWNKTQGTNVLYASVVNGGSLNGWYRSTNRGVTWTSVNQSPLPTSPIIYRSAIGKGAATNQDVLYTLAGNVSTQCPVLDGPIESRSKERLFKGVFTNTSTSWTLVTTTKNCQSKADCCDDGDCLCIDGTTAVTTCPVGHTCTCYESADCGGMRSVQVAPDNSEHVVLGTEYTYRSCNGGQTGFKQLARDTLHVDIQSLTFNPLNSSVLWNGNDGGIWRSDNFFLAQDPNCTQDPTWVNLNANLSNIEFHFSGQPDVLNHGMSWGGTQDNGLLKGGNPDEWFYLYGGDESIVLIDPKNSNYAYTSSLFAGDGVQRSTNGGKDHCQIAPDSLAFGISGPHEKIAMGPNSATGPTTLIAFSPIPWAQGGRRIYRTTNADGGTPNCSTKPTWSSVTESPTGGLPDVISMTISHSNPGLIFATTNGSGQLVWRTANARDWTSHGPGQLPGRILNSLEIDRSQACTSTNCTLYAAASGFNGTGIPGHVFRSTNAGVTWTDISGPPCSGPSCTSFPDVPANKIIIHPSCPNFLYVATDLGIFQGTLNNGQCGTPNTGAWTWATFTNGFPKTALVRYLAAVPQAGLLRAYTFGRSAWSQAHS